MIEIVKTGIIRHLTEEVYFHARTLTESALGWEDRNILSETSSLNRQQIRLDQAIERHGTGMFFDDSGQNDLSPAFLRLKNRSLRESAILRSREMASTEEHVGVARYFKRCVLSEGELKDVPAAADRLEKYIKRDRAKITDQRLLNRLGVIVRYDLLDTPIRVWIDDDLYEVPWPFVMNRRASPAATLYHAWADDEKLMASFEVFIDECLAPSGLESRELFDLVVDDALDSPEGQQALYRWIGHWHGRNVSEQVREPVEWSIRDVIDLLICAGVTDDGSWRFYRKKSLQSTGDPV